MKYKSVCFFSLVTSKSSLYPSYGYIVIGTLRGVGAGGVREP